MKKIPPIYPLAKVAVASVRFAVWFVICGMLWVVPHASAKELARSSPNIGTCVAGKADKRLDINFVRARITNTGGLFWNGDPNVYEVPINSNNQAIFASGLWIGGTVNGELRIAAARYGNWEFWPGPLDNNGNPPADCKPYDRIFKVSKDDIKAVWEGKPPVIAWPE